jgi:hypothetical protein
MYTIVTCVVLVAVFWIVNAMLLYWKNKSEGFLGAANATWSKGANGYGFTFVNPTRTTLTGEGCRMPADYNASQIPYCESLGQLNEKVACYSNCVQTYTGGIRGRCYPNILDTYNKYAYQLGSPHFQPIAPAVCTENDPCCDNVTSSFGMYNFLEQSSANQVRSMM